MKILIDSLAILGISILILSVFSLVYTLIFVYKTEDTPFDEFDNFNSKHNADAENTKLD